MGLRPWVHSVPRSTHAARTTSDSRASVDCSPPQIEKYLSRISGPLIDRIDIHIEVPPVPYRELRGQQNGSDSATIREQVLRARQIQRQRYGEASTLLNGSIGSSQLRKHCKVDEAGEAILKQALTELRNLARGIHPAILTDRGLDAALSALAARSSVPVEISVDLGERPSVAVESTAYFVVAEALTNATKHAAATRLEVRIRREEGVVVVEIEDNGVGGARIEPGGGLEGLTTRVATVDGTLTISSPARGPTIVRAEVPCAS